MGRLRSDVARRRGESRAGDRPHDSHVAAGRVLIDHLAAKFPRCALPLFLQYWYIWKVTRPADLSAPSTSGYAPRGGRVLLGPLLTEGQFARRIGRPAWQIRHQPFLLRVSGPISVGPAYPAFLLDGSELRLDVVFLVLLLRRRVTDLEACDWLVRPQGALGNRSPLVWLTAGHSLESVVAALPEPTRPLPAGAARPRRDEIRRAWLDFKHDQATPGLEIAWDQLARTRKAAYPPGI